LVVEDLGMKPPTGILEITKLYGDPSQHIRDDGTVGPFWEARMVKVEMPEMLPLGWRPDVRVRSARVNQAIAAEAQGVLRMLHGAGLWTKLVSYDGGYAWRPQRGSSKLSMHGFGGALDFNANTNQLGSKGDMDPGVVQIFEDNGWEWGGRWKRPDPMHFQFARGY
jgi:hypothetical protein